MLAALIGSWIYTDEFGAPQWMLERAMEYMYANEEEQVIRIGGMTTTSAGLVEQFQMQHTLIEMTAYPRLLLGRAGHVDRGVRCYGQCDCDLRCKRLAL